MSRFAIKTFVAALIASVAFADVGSAQQRANAAPASPPPTAVPAGPVGLWLDHTGRGAIEIVNCGNDLCGRIVWLQQPNDPTGRPLRDTLNEDASKRGKPICGLQIIGGAKKQSDGSWDNGWIYDPEKGEHFDLELRMRSADNLQVKGYKGLKFLNETYQWRRAAQLPSPRCVVGA